MWFYPPPLPRGCSLLLQAGKVVFWLTSFVCVPLSMFIRVNQAWPSACCSTFGSSLYNFSSWENKLPYFSVPVTVNSRTLWQTADKPEVDTPRASRSPCPQASSGPLSCAPDCWHPGSCFAHTHLWVFSCPSFFGWDQLPLAFFLCGGYRIFFLVPEF